MPQKHQTKCVIRKKSVVYVSVLSCPPDFSDDPKRRSHYFYFLVYKTKSPKWNLIS